MLECLVIQCWNVGDLPECRVVCVPGDDRNPDVLSKLEEVLRGDRVSAVVLVSRQVDDGSRLTLEEPVADLVEHLQKISQI